jgi:MFS family permease
MDAPCARAWRACDARHREARAMSVANELPGALPRRALAMFLLARIASSVAFQAMSVAVGWQIYRQTGSALNLGFIGLVQFIPMAVLTLVAGHVADRFDRRRIVIVCLSIQAAVASALAAGVLGGWLGQGLIYVLIAIGSSARAFESPTFATLLPALVPRAELPRATAWFASSSQAAQILGPAVGGIVYAIGAAYAFGLVAALCAAGAMLIAGLALRRASARREPVTLASFFSGVHFIRSRPVILGTISLDLFAVLLGGATALLPIFAKDVLATGPWGLGLLRAAPAVGALAMSTWLGVRPLSGRIGHTLFGSLALFGLATVCFGLSRSLPLSLAALFVLGAADSVSVVVRTSLVQLQTPQEMLGRVSAVNMLFIGTSNQLGEFESGLTAAWFGAVPATVIGGVGTLLVSAAWMAMFPALRRMRSLEG